MTATVHDPAPVEFDPRQTALLIIGPVNQQGFQQRGRLVDVLGDGDAVQPPHEGGGKRVQGHSDEKAVEQEPPGVGSLPEDDGGDEVRGSPEPLVLEGGFEHLFDAHDGAGDEPGDRGCQDHGAGGRRDVAR